MLIYHPPRTVLGRIQNQTQKYDLEWPYQSQKSEPCTKVPSLALRTRAGSLNRTQTHPSFSMLRAEKHAEGNIEKLRWALVRC